jgi:phosphatidylglycerol phospholipase C
MALTTLEKLILIVWVVVVLTLSWEGMNDIRRYGEKQSLNPFVVGAVNHRTPIKKTRSLCVGHRGYSSEYPENTMLSLEQALLQGADGLELDVHTTLDEQVILLHDDSLERTTNGSGVVFQRNYYNYIEHLVSSTHRTYENEPIPLFAEVLLLLTVHQNAFILVDIKPTNPVTILDMMIDIMRTEFPDYDFSDQVYFGIWNADFLKQARSVAPEFPASFIGANLEDAAEFFDMIENYNVKFSSVEADGTRFLNLVRSSPCKRTVFAWTINKPDDMRSAFNTG